MKKYFPFLVLSLILSSGALEAMKVKKPSSSEEGENHKHTSRLRASNLTLEDIERKYKGLGLTSERKNSEVEIKEPDSKMPTEELNLSRSSSGTEDYTLTEIDMDALEEQNEGDNLNFMKERKRKLEELAQISNERQTLHKELNALTYEEKSKEEKDYLFKYFLALEKLIKARKVREIEHSEELRQKRLNETRALYKDAKKEYLDFKERMKKEKK